MGEVVAGESMKYSSRSPIPCTWRLEITTRCVGEYENDLISQSIPYGSVLSLLTSLFFSLYTSIILFYFFQLMIDMGRSSVSKSDAYYSNQVVNESAWLFERQKNDVPPPYCGPSTGFCSQYNVARQHTTIEFCSLCGHSFNKQ